MIAEQEIGKRKFKGKRVRLARSARPNSLRMMLLLIWCFTLFGLLQPTVVGYAAAEALALCAEKLIPSLFPLAAAGSVLAEASTSGRTSARSRFIGPILGWMGLSPASGICVLMGLFAGFPVGAIIASSLVESGRIDSEEGSRLCCFTGNASAAFLVGAVGDRLFGDIRIGWLLWTAQSIAALTVGIFMGRRAMKRADKVIAAQPTDGTPESALAPAPIGWGTVSRAIASSAQGMLALVAFVVFFSAFTAFIQNGIGALLDFVGAGSAVGLIQTAVSGFFEISNGLKNSALLGQSIFVRVLLAAAITGWSGLSVYMQVLAAAKGLNAEHTAALPRRLALAKGASAALTVAYAAVLYGVV